MGKKGLSFEEKRQKILEIYYEKVSSQITIHHHHYRKKCSIWRK